MLRTLLKLLTRTLVLRGLFFLPEGRKIALERRLRGREEARRLRAADVVVVSYGKSGRTWVRVMLSRFYQLRYGFSARHLIGFDNLHRKNRAIPKVLFTHDNYIRDYTGNLDNKADFYGKKVILLVRDPRDTAVSQYFQWRYRMRPNKKPLNKYPPHGADVSLYDFVVDENAGLPRIIDFLNGWAAERERVGQLLILRYEDLRTDPAARLEEMLRFIGEQPLMEEIQAAVDFASIENMRAMEQKRVFWLSGSRLVPKDRANPNSYKVRRAKVGGYRDDFSADQLAAIDAMVAARLAPVFGYGAPKDVRAAPSRAAGA